MRVGHVLLGLVTLTSVHISSGQTCSNGYPGLQNGNACCDRNCGTCGGPGCALRPPGAAGCCVGTITRDNNLCSKTGAAPCVIDTCKDNVQGIKLGNVCCDGSCRQCGGAGCGGRPGGAAYCCTGPITTANVSCSDTSAAPCIIYHPAETLEPVCSDSTPGIELSGACCEAQCGTCGGPGCAQRPGGKDACCTSIILGSDIFCADTSTAPCIVAPSLP